MDSLFESTSKKVRSLPMKSSYDSYQYDEDEDFLEDTGGTNGGGGSGVNSFMDDTGSNEQDIAGSTLPIAEAIVQDHKDNKAITLSKQQTDFQILMDSRKTETNDFRLMILSIGLTLISIGILANLLFNLLVLLRKRKRQTCTTLIMFSMCFAYLIYLAFYSLKLSIYFNGDNITKYHIYDTIDNWMYGSFLCKFLSALPICVKLISRLSILTIITKRVLLKLICAYSYSSSTSHQEKEAKHDYYDNTNSTSSNDFSNSTTGRINVNSNSSKKNVKTLNKKLSILCKLFEWPALLILIALIWMISIASSWPVYSMYKLSKPPTDVQSISLTNVICDSEYSFPEDSKKVAKIYLNYLIYSLIVPCSLIFILLAFLSLLQSRLCSKMLSASSSSTSFDEDEVNSSSSSSSTSGVQQCTKHTSSKYNNTILLWLMFLIHLLTSVPQELYRYMQLNVDFNDENVLDSYLTSIMMQPLVKARAYYAMQLVYTSEFTLMPLMFILFYACSNKCCGSKKAKAKTTINKNYDDEEDINEMNVNIIKEATLLSKMRTLFFDAELDSSKQAGKIVNEKMTGGVRRAKRNLAFNKIVNHDLDVPSSNASNASTHLNEALLAANQQKHHMNGRKMSSSSLKQTPFELVSEENEQLTSYGNNLNTTCNNGNIVHVIQHPSWRMNIKQQQTPQY